MELVKIVKNQKCPICNQVHDLHLYKEEVRCVENGQLYTYEEHFYHCTNEIYKRKNRLAFKEASFIDTEMNFVNKVSLHQAKNR